MIKFVLFPFKMFFTISPLLTGEVLIDKKRKISIMKITIACESFDINIPNNIKNKKTRCFISVA